MAFNSAAILVYDDEPMIAGDLAHFLQSRGSRVHVAQTVQEALDVVVRERLAGAIVDYGLEEEGAVLCVRLQAEGVPFVLYSGCFEDVQPVLDAPHIHKPAEPARVVAALEELIALRKKKAGIALEGATPAQFVMANARTLL